MMKELSFYYDVVCPFAYLASTLVESLASRTNARLVWKPVLLGALAHTAPQALAVLSSPPPPLQEAFTKRPAPLRAPVGQPQTLCAVPSRSY